MRSTILMIATLLPIVCASLWGQSDDAHTLHMLPELNVEVSTSLDIWLRVLGMEKVARYTNQFEDKVVTSKRISVDRKGSITSTTLLPMVFFDQASPTIPDRYQVFSRGSETHEYVDSAEIISAGLEYADDGSNPKYYELLNIIGYRMTQHPNTTIRLEGGYSTEPGENAQVGMARARELSFYLTSMWRIDSSRIGVLPPRQMCDSSDNILVQEEARRVIIHTDSWELLRPVYYYHAFYSAPPLTLFINIDPWVEKNEVSEIELILAKGEEILSRTVIPGNPDSTRYRLTGMCALPRTVPYLLEGISAQAVVRTRSGMRRASNVVSLFFDIVDKRTPFHGNDSTADQYDGAIMFFESSDTALSPYQITLLQHRYKSMEQTAQLQPKESWTVRIFAIGDLSEYSDVDDAILVTRRSEARHQNTLHSRLWNDESLQSTLYLFSEYPTQIEMDQLVDDTAPLIIELIDNRIAEIYDVWFGDRADEVYKTRVLRGSEDISVSRESQSQFEGLLNRRATNVSQHLQNFSDPQLIDTIISEEPYPEYLGSSRRIEYLPERRFYQRLARVSISPSYQYNGEYDAYETIERTEPATTRD